MEVIKYDHLPQAAKRIRTQVFIDEQKFKVEFDETDAVCTHLVMFEGNSAAAVCRYFYSEEKGCYMIGRVAVDRAHRGKGFGAAMMLEAERFIGEDGGKCIAVSAQCRVRGFYERLGYKAASDEYLDEYCPHILMKKKLKEPLNKSRPAD